MNPLDDKAVLASLAAASAPEPDRVLAALRRKRTRRLRRRAAVTAGALALVTAGFALTHGIPGLRDAQEPPAVALGGSVCGDTPWEQHFSYAREIGGSFVVAKGTLTGRDHTMERTGERMYEMRLSGIRTFFGPAVAEGALVWIPSATTRAGGIMGQPAGSLWATDGSLMAFLNPDPGAREELPRPFARIAPVIGDRLVTSAAGCWAPGGLASEPYTAELAEIPGSDSYQRAAVTGIESISLKKVERIARHTAGASR
ncbi:hypothetical protein [Streptomyces sp. NPDC004435]|uniref:hypothetical protein n=1 Tax=Streptomyces sp. NPDC004435 TaxID=3364701 RepID=UPI003680C768